MDRFPLRRRRSGPHDAGECRGRPARMQHPALLSLVSTKRQRCLRRLSLYHHACDGEGRDHAAEPLKTGAAFLYSPKMGEPNPARGSSAALCHLPRLRWRRGDRQGQTHRRNTQWVIGVPHVLRICRDHTEDCLQGPAHRNDRLVSTTILRSRSFGQRQQNGLVLDRSAIPGHHALSRLHFSNAQSILHFGAFPGAKSSSSSRRVGLFVPSPRFA